MSNSTNREKELASKGSQLCLSCGLCCRGLLQNHYPLESGETKLATRIGLPVHSGEDRSNAFSLPCALYREDKCSVYPNRPKACRDYQCDILKKYLKGTISLEQSLELVASAKDLMNSIRRHTGNGDPGKRIWTSIAEYLDRQGDEPNSEAFRQANADLLLDEKQLAFICRHFEMNKSIVTATPPPPPITGSNRPEWSPDGKGLLEPPADVRVGKSKGQIVISSTKTGEYIGLIGVAADMWRALCEYSDLEGVVTALLRQYDIDEATLRADLHAFVDGLLARGLMELRDASQPNTSAKEQASAGF